MCSTKWDMYHKMYLDAKISQVQSFTNIFSKLKLSYMGVILTKVIPNLTDILEILKLYTHLSTNLSHCPYHVKYINHKQEIKYFAIIWQPVRSEFVFDPIYPKKHKNTWFHVLLANFDTCLVMPYTGGRRKHDRKSIESEPTYFNN